ncbi:hypothetical protein MTO96_015506 [Rhipicephalus appendiculatus]
MVNNPNCACSIKLTTFAHSIAERQPFYSPFYSYSIPPQLGVQSSSPGTYPNIVGRLARNFGCVEKSGSGSVQAEDHARVCDSEILPIAGEAA